MCLALISPFCVKMSCRIKNLGSSIAFFVYLEFYTQKVSIEQATGQKRLDWLALQVSNLSVGDSPSLLMMLWCSVSSPLEHWFYCILSHLFSAFWTLFLLFSSTYETLLLLFTSRAPLLLSIFLSGGNPQPDGGGGQSVQLITFDSSLKHQWPSGLVMWTWMIWAGPLLATSTEYSSTHQGLS